MNLKKQIELLRDERRENSITPAQVGGILLDILEHVDSKEITGSNVIYKDINVEVALNDLYNKVNKSAEGVTESRVMTMIAEALSWEEISGI